MAKPKGNKTAPISRAPLIAVLVLTLLTTGFSAVSATWSYEWSESGDGTWEASHVAMGTGVALAVWNFFAGIIIPALDLDHKLSNKARLQAWLIYIVVGAAALIAFIGGGANKAAALGRLQDRYDSYGDRYPRYYNYRFQYNFQFPFWFVAIVLQIVNLSVASIYLHKFRNARKDVEPTKADGWNELAPRHSTAKSEIDTAQA